MRRRPALALLPSQANIASCIPSTISTEAGAAGPTP
jgi:hypothetical protein